MVSRTSSKLPKNSAMALCLNPRFEARNNGTQNPSPNRAYGPPICHFSSIALFMARQRLKVPKIELRAPDQEKSPIPSPEPPRSFQQNTETTLQWHLPPPPSFLTRRGTGLSMASPRCSPQTDSGAPSMVARVLGRAPPKLCHEASRQIKA
ncbi:hypothetical protein Nepgr_020502 [Nepenthes gracilis]|uniref:Uncharacterized protein n=1 Tax=Nepenthes gracilis TaxID=150966 RepID=A0AAD3XWF5_NEPGR|nr:hypothetical protein Nepgr_020502 [Nepenthes gracilis]